MNITILGGGGFIGSHLAEAFLAENHTLTIFDHHNADRRNIAHIENRVNFVGGDFFNTQEVIPAIEHAELVVHLISSTLPGNSLNNPVYDVETNVIASINLFQECVKSKVRKIIYISSGGTVYGIPQTLPIPEGHPLNPISPYGLSKHTIEKYLGLFFYHYGLDYTVLRLSNPYGKRQNPHLGQGVISSWIHNISMGEPIEIWGNGEVVRDYLYIKDAVEAINMASITNSDEKVFNVGSGQGYSLNEVHKILEKCAGRTIPVRYKAIRKVDVPANVLDTTLIQNTLGWHAKTSIEDGVRMTMGSI